MLFKKLVFVGALADEDFAEIFIIGFFLARSKIAHEVHNVKIIERVGLTVRVRTGTV